MSERLFQDSKTGKLVEFIGKHDKEFAMVKDAVGNVSYLTLDQLVPYDKNVGRLSKVKAPSLSCLKRKLQQQLCLSKTVGLT